MDLSKLAKRLFEEAIILEELLEESILSEAFGELDEPDGSEFDDGEDTMKKQREASKSLVKKAKGPSPNFVTGMNAGAQAAQQHLQTAGPEGKAQFQPHPPDNMHPESQLGYHHGYYHAFHGSDAAKSGQPDVSPDLYSALKKYHQSGNREISNNQPLNDVLAHLMTSPQYARIIKSAAKETGVHPDDLESALSSKTAEREGSSKASPIMNLVKNVSGHVFTPQEGRKAMHPNELFGYLRTAALNAGRSIKGDSEEGHQSAFGDEGELRADVDAAGARKQTAAPAQNDAETKAAHEHFTKMFHNARDKFAMMPAVHQGMQIKTRGRYPKDFPDLPKDAVNAAFLDKDGQLVPAFFGKDTGEGKDQLRTNTREVVKALMPKYGQAYMEREKKIADRHISDLVGQYQELLNSGVDAQSAVGQISGANGKADSHATELQQFVSQNPGATPEQVVQHLTQQSDAKLPSAVEGKLRTYVSDILNDFKHYAVAHHDIGQHVDDAERERVTQTRARRGEAHARAEKKGGAAPEAEPQDTSIEKDTETEVDPNVSATLGPKPKDPGEAPKAIDRSQAKDPNFQAAKAKWERQKAAFDDWQQKTGVLQTVKSGGEVEQPGNPPEGYGDSKRGRKPQSHYDFKDKKLKAFTALGMKNVIPGYKDRLAAQGQEQPQEPQQEPQQAAPEEAPKAQAPAQQTPQEPQAPQAQQPQEQPKEAPKQPEQDPEQAQKQQISAAKDFLVANPTIPDAKADPAGYEKWRQMASTWRKLTGNFQLPTENKKPQQPQDPEDEETTPDTPEAPTEDDQNERNIPRTESLAHRLFGENLAGVVKCSSMVEELTRKVK